jgi:hypothetical protein
MINKLSSVETTDNVHHANRELIDLAALDNEDDEVSEINPVPDCFKNCNIEDFPQAVQDQLRLELMTKTKLCHLYDKQQSDLVVKEGEYQMTGMHFIGEDRKKISSVGRLKLYYCIEWYLARKESKKKWKNAHLIYFGMNPSQRLQLTLEVKTASLGLSVSF